MILKITKIIESFDLKEQDQNDFLLREYLPRVSYVALLILAPLAFPIDVAVVTAQTTLSLFSLGKIDLLKDNHIENYVAIIRFPSIVFLLFLKIINPYARVSDTYEVENGSSKSIEKYEIDAYGNGFVTSLARPRLEKIASDLFSSDNTIKKQVLSRLIHGVLIVVCIATRLLDAIISVPAVIGSLVTLGKITSLNNLAFRCTQYFDLPFDILECVAKIYNPRTKISMRFN